MKTNLEKAKRLLRDNAAIYGVELPEDGFLMELLELAASGCNESYNKAVKDCSESATAYIAQDTVNGGKVAKVNKESILKNLKQ
jgi:hypothetical protein